ncbi:MAG: hypothetical protein LH614_10335 [Pyrinomonadaceae bacterium]|nr:hypothetical protein [Pyrinomonadaceae bacterium]
MGQYFRFVNATKRTESRTSLSSNFGLSLEKNLHRIYDERLDEIFDSVIKANNWEEADAIIAVGDDGDIVYRPIKL